MKVTPEDVLYNCSIIRDVMERGDHLAVNVHTGSLKIHKAEYALVSTGGDTPTNFQYQQLGGELFDLQATGDDYIFNIIKRLGQGFLLVKGTRKSLTCDGKVTSAATRNTISNFVSRNS